MSAYIATFHTHLSAMRTYRTLQAAGVEARMEPVPRKLSSSCGTCVRYDAHDDCAALLDGDAQALYRADGPTFTLICAYD